MRKATSLVLLRSEKRLRIHLRWIRGPLKDWARVSSRGDQKADNIDRVSDFDASIEATKASTTVKIYSQGAYDWEVSGSLSKDIVLSLDTFFKKDNVSKRGSGKSLFLRSKNFGVLKRLLRLWAGVCLSPKKYCWALYCVCSI